MKLPTILDSGTESPAISAEPEITGLSHTKTKGVTIIIIRMYARFPS